MADEYGITETKEIVGFMISLGEGYALAAKDGWSYDDFMHFMEAFQRGPSAFAGITLVPKELADLSPEEAQELKDYVAADFDIENDKLEDTIERALQLGVDLYEFIRGMFPELFVDE